MRIHASNMLLALFIAVLAGGCHRIGGVKPEDTAAPDCEQTDQTTWYADVDGDGYGDAGTSLLDCTQPTGFVADATDCDDTNPAVHPGAPEVCDGLDDDCDGLLEGQDPDLVDGTTWCQDADRDGYGDPTTGTNRCSQPTGSIADCSDCDDAHAAVNPAAAEVCDGRDNDCDGQVDADATDAPTWYADADGDEYGDATATTTACSQPTGFVADASDCDDGDAAVHPGAPEVCDGLDDDCDGLLEGQDPDLIDGVTWYPDGDGDGYGAPRASVYRCSQPRGYVFFGSDCDDADDAIHPGAAEVCDGIDNDCDGSADPACCEDTGDACEGLVAIELYDEDNPFLGYSFRGGCYSGGDDPDEIVLWSPYARAAVEVATVDSAGADVTVQAVTVPAGGVQVVECYAGEVLRVDSDQPLQVLMTGTTDTSVLWDDDWIGLYGSDLLIRLLSVRGSYGIVSYDDGNTVSVTSIDGVSAALDTISVLDAGETLLLSDFRDLGYSFSADVWLHVESTFPVSTVFGMFSDNAGTQLYSADMTNYLAPIYGSHAVLVSGGDQVATVTVVERVEGATPTTSVIPAESLHTFSVSVSDWALVDISSDVPVVAITQDTGSGFAPAIQYSSLDAPGRVGSSYGVPVHKSGPEVTVISLVDDNDITLWGCLTASFTLDANGYGKPGSCAGASVLMASGTGPFVLDTSYGTENATAWLPVSGVPTR